MAARKTKTRTTRNLSASPAAPVAPAPPAAAPLSASVTTLRCSRSVTVTRLVRQRSVYIVCGILYLLHMQQYHMSCALDAAAIANYAGGSDESDELKSSVAVGRTAHEPKFGERLLPLMRKKQNSANGFGTGGPRSSSAAGLTGAGWRPASVSGQAQTTRSVNSFLHKSNYVVSHDDVALAELTEEGRSAAAAVGRSANDPAELYTVVAVTALDENAHLVPEHVDQQRRVDGSGVYDTYTGTSANRRQSKQLRRREDVSMDEESPAAVEVEKTANVSTADRLVVMSTEFFVVPTSSSSVSPASSTTPSSVRLGAKSRGMPVHLPPPGPRSVLIVAPKTTVSANSSATPPTIVSTLPTFTGLRKEPWVVPVLVLAALTMLMMAAFEIFVLFKAWRTSPSRRHLFLGQMLLLGLFACAGLGAVITAQPSLLSCGAIRFGVGVAYALVFAALLVKCVFLISLNGGVYLPAPYQGLLLLFAVLIQVAIGAQWLLTQPPEIYTLSVPVMGSGLLASTSTLTSSAQISPDSTSSTNAGERFSGLFYPGAGANVGGAGGGIDHIYARISATGTVLIPLCKTQFSELLFSLIYIVFLIVFVAVLAIKSRGIRDNYREATYIGLAIGGAIPIWLGWMLCGLAVAERHKDACIAFGLIATSATVFLVMFMPKGRQLAAMGKEGLYVEDREEQFSSLSRAGSGYSPSFFHFKPIKYGVMGGGGGGGGGMQNSATNTGNGASMKHCSNAMNGGDRVALVTAAPPSYTRMYHYFPAHLTTHHPTFCFYPHQPPPPQPPPPPPLTQLPSPPTLKQLGNSLSSMTQAHIAQTLRYPGLFIRPDETNLYTTLEPTLSSNPNVYFQRGGAVHPGMMY